MQIASTGVFGQWSGRLTWLLVAVATLNGAYIAESWAAGSAGADRLALVTAIVFCAALVSSVAGFAFSALAGAALAHLSLAPTEAVRIMLVCSITIQVYSVIRLSGAIDWRRLAPFLLGGAATVPLGIALLARVSAAAFSLGLGALLVAYGAYMLLRRSEIVVKGNAYADAAIGALGGVTGGLAAFPGAFVTAWCGMKGWTKDQQRAVFQPYILAMQLLALALLESSVPTSPSGDSALVFVPIVVLAAHLGIAVFRKLSNRQFNCAVYGLLIAAGLTLTAKFA
jgi:uncharacterized membrane protein YfcA